MTEHQLALAACVGAFVQELGRSGLRHVCICPGSRSTPLAIACASMPDLRVWMHLDERSAAYFALGLAKASGTPVALVCTSGTAAANFFPAVVEACYAGVPLLVLTADRPAELQHSGANQTIDQQHLYGIHAKWFVNMPLPEARSDVVRYFRTLACRAVAVARDTVPGPVHMNMPFREPLVPLVREADAVLGEVSWYVPPLPDGAPFARIDTERRGIASAEIDMVADALLQARRGIIVCGPQPDPLLATDLCQLADLLRMPVLADPLSQLRYGPHNRSSVIDRYEAALRHPPVAALAPDLVLRFGAVPASRPLTEYLQRHIRIRQIAVNRGGWCDPALGAVEVIQGNPRFVCEALIKTITSVRADAMAHDDDGGRALIPHGPDDAGERNRDGGAAWPRAAIGHPPTTQPEDPTQSEGDVPIGGDHWLALWQRVDRVVGEAIDREVGASPWPSETRLVSELRTILPDHATLFIGNSMPVRDMDTFFPGRSASLRLLSNRGASGIDGLVSSALGAAATSDDPVVLCIGDLSFYHDLNGLLAAKQHAISLTIVLVNNDGGGIFSFLPQAAYPEQFELLFGTPHGLDFHPVVEMYGGSFQRATSWESLRGAVTSGISSGGLHVVEMRTDRTVNVRQHADVWSAAARALVSARLLGSTRT